jgi:hypothetical protein
MNSRFLMSALRIISILLIVNFLGPRPAFSQSGSSNASTQSRTHKTSMPGGERSMRGCLSRDASGAYLLQTQRGEKVKLNSAEDLTSHVGQQVKVSGSFVNPNAGRPHSSSSPKQLPKREGMPEFQTVKVDVLAQTCTVPSPKKKNIF